MKRWLAALPVCWLLGAAAAAAAPPRSWTASTAEQFARGTLDGTAVDEEGGVRLASDLETLWGPERGIVWGVQTAGPGAAFVALSGPGRVLRVEAGREPVTWYEAAGEGLVTAIAADGTGGLFVGLSPEGRVLQLSAAGVEGRRLETGSSFVWSLAVGTDGRLWVATGVPGRVLRESPQGQLETIFEAGDDPVKCLVPGPGGGAVAGTGGRGRVVRIGADMGPFVVFDADEPEIVAVAAGEGGTLFALATRGAKQVRAERPPAAVRIAATAPTQEEAAEPAEIEEAVAPPPAPAPPRLDAPAGGALYRIEPGGGAQAIWSTENEMPFAMARMADGRLLVATGDDGRLHAVDATGHAVRLLRIPSNQASALALGAEGEVLVGGTTDARVVRMGPGPRRSGTYLSPPIDAGTFADWGRVVWQADEPRGTALGVSVRAGNTDPPDATWSDWGAPNVATTRPATRWFQLRVQMQGRDGRSPRLSGLEIFYQPRNRAPRITGLTIEPPGVVWALGPAQAQTRLGPLATDDPIARRVAADLAGVRGQPRMPPIRKSYELGGRTFHWTALDPDGDRLRCALRLRPEGTGHWFPLAADLEGGFHTRDVRDLPDGLYRVRLSCDDSLDHPSGESLAHEATSDAFHVDNTRPALERFDVTREGEGTSVEFVVHDAGGSVAAVEVAVEDGAWEALEPLDGVADSAEERYRMALERSGVSLRVRVTDAAGNLAGYLRRVD